MPGYIAKVLRRFSFTEQSQLRAYNKSEILPYSLSVALEAEPGEGSREVEPEERGMPEPVLILP
jgi:hypothetical protein